MLPRVPARASTVRVATADGGHDATLDVERTELGTDASSDGRRVRRARNRIAVLEALVAFYREGCYQPSAGEVAERAGLSPRSLYRYFDDVDDLSRAAIDQQLERARPHLAVAATDGDPTAVKIEALVSSRLRLFEAIAPAARAARVNAARNPLIAAQIAQARSYLRAQLSRLFASELGAIELPGEADATLRAVDVLCSFESYELLHGDDRLSAARHAATLSSALARLLGSRGHVPGSAPAGAPSTPATKGPR